MAGTQGIVNSGPPLHAWENRPEMREKNDGMGACNTGSGVRDPRHRDSDGSPMPIICLLGGIGCNVDHRKVRRITAARAVNAPYEAPGPVRRPTYLVEVVPAREIDAGEMVVFDRFGDVETVLQIEFRTPADDMRRVRTTHPVRNKVGMPLMDDTPVMRVARIDS